MFYRLIFLEFAYVTLKPQKAGFADVHKQIPKIRKKLEPIISIIESKILLSLVKEFDAAFYQKVEECVTK